MNDIQSINTQYSQICELIEQQRLKEAIALLHSYLLETQNWELTSQLEQIDTSYQYMLQYMRQGIQDPERYKLYRSLTLQTRQIAEQVHLVLLDKVSSSYFHECRRNLIGRERPLEETLHTLESFADDLAVSRLVSGNLQQLLKRHEEAQRQWFQLLWTNSQWGKQEEQLLQRALQSASLSVTDLCLAVSAITLSLTQCFDPRKLMWLIDVYQHKQPVEASQRALVGIVLTLYLHPDIQKLHPEVKSRLLLMNEQSPLDEDVLRIYKQFLLSQETDNIDKKMREEILPEMLKNVSKLKDMKIDIDDLDDENDFNPDWEKMMNNTELENKMREMSELQMEGADVYMGTFAQLKSFPFFYELHNWFLPFDANHSIVVDKLGADGKKNSVINLIMSSGFFCNSDKYSLLLMLNNFPQSQQEMIFSQLTDQQMEGVADQSKADTMKSLAERPSTLSNQYIHDLYRFYKLNSHRRDFVNPFEQALNLEEKPILADLLQPDDLLATLAEYRLKKEHWKDAIRILQLILDHHNEMSRQADIYQKLGYAQQKMRQYSQAIESFRKADTIKPDNRWNIQHLATCYRITQQYEPALELYRKIESGQPDNTKTIFHIASCLAELGHNEEALKYFFKLNYLENDSIKSWRGIAWCSFASDKYEQAQTYYDKIIAQKPVAADYLNAGHVAWVTGHTAQAADYYEKASKACTSHQEFAEMFAKDRLTLLAKGIADSDLPLMLDLLN